MKQNKKGFTLVELLAVIVILAIIALIATPIILGVIDNAREGAAKDTAYGYIDAVEKQIAIDMLSAEAAGTQYTKTSFGTEVSVKGTVPKSASLTYTNGKLEGDIAVGDYTYHYNGTSLSLSSAK